MKILVLISNVPDTTTKIRFSGDNTAFDDAGVQWIINPWDELALTRAMELKEAGGVDKITVANAVGISSDNTAEIQLLIEIFIQTVVSQDDVGRLTVPIRADYGNNNPAVVGNLNFNTPIIGQGIEVHPGSVRSFAKAFFDNRGHLIPQACMKINENSGILLSDKRRSNGAFIGLPAIASRNFYQYR